MNFPRAKIVAKRLVVKPLLLLVGVYDTRRLAAFAPQIFSQILYSSCVPLPYVAW